MKNTVNVIECAIEFENKFLIIERPSGVHAGGMLAFPGGKVEEQDAGGDILKNAVKREVLEEVGIALKNQISYVTSSYFVDSKATPVIDTIFHTILDSKPQVIASPREVPKYYWMTKEEILQANNSPEWLKKYIGLINVDHKIGTGNLGIIYHLWSVLYNKSLDTRAVIEEIFHEDYMQSINGIIMNRTEYIDHVIEQRRTTQSFEFKCKNYMENYDKLFIIYNAIGKTIQGDDFEAEIMAYFEFKDKKIFKIHGQVHLSKGNPSDVDMK